MLTYGLLISSLFNGDVPRGLIVFLQYLFAYVGLPWAICGRSYKDAETLAKYAVYSMIIMCLFGIGAYAWGYNGGYATHFAIVSGSGRLSSLVDNPNGLAGLIAFTFPVLWYLTGVGTFRLMTAAILSVPLFYALILTSSNTGLISTSVAMIVFVVGRGKIKLFFAGLVFAVGVFGAVHIWGAQILPAVFQKRVLSAATEADISEAGTFESRYDLMAEAWRLADHNMLMGMGADQYRVFSDYGLPVHNTYLLLLNEGGLISMVGFTVILASALMTAYTARQHRHGDLILLSMVTIVATMAVTSMSYAHMYARFLVVPMLVVAGLAVSYQSVSLAVRTRRSLPADRSVVSQRR